jgi:hypothetical protein
MLCSPRNMMLATFSDAGNTSGKPQARDFTQPCGIYLAQCRVASCRIYATNKTKAMPMQHDGMATISHKSNIQAHPSYRPPAFQPARSNAGCAEPRKIYFTAHARLAMHTRRNPSPTSSIASQAHFLVVWQLLQFDMRPHDQPANSPQPSPANINLASSNS